MVKRAAEAAGLDAERFSGHSLRLGFVTTAARRGCTERLIPNQTGHRSMVVLRGYIRRANVFEDNAAVVVAWRNPRGRLLRPLTALRPDCQTSGSDCHTKPRPVDGAEDGRESPAEDRVGLWDY